VSVAAFAVLLLGVGASGPPTRAIPLATAGSPGQSAGAADALEQDSSFVGATLDRSVPIAATRRRAWDERLVGGSGAESLAGGRGDDLIDGRGGADELSGGRGDDLIRGGPGRDTIDAGPGDDVVVTWQDGRRDAVDCGAGVGDRAVADAADVLVDCEVVDRREPLT
jgi:Ca2+-binding RTX toxin-like protein